MTPRTPPDLHTYLGDFFRFRGAHLSGRRLSRLRALEAALHDCIESECDDLLTDDELTLVRLERELEPGCALARVTSPRLVPLVLRRFLTWIPGDAVDRRLQLSILAEILKAAGGDRSLVAQREWVRFAIDVLTLETDIVDYRRDFERERRRLAIGGRV